MIEMTGTKKAKTKNYLIANNRNDKMVTTSYSYGV